MVDLSCNILFSGIGCQEQGIIDTGLFNVDVKSTSDINKDAIVSYAAMHCGLTNELVDTYDNYPSREEMAKQLNDMNIGFDPTKGKKYDWNKAIKKKSKDIEKTWLACKLSNQFGDISKIDKLPYADFWSVSFPCQDISVAGKINGFNPDSGTRSSLLWENMRLLKDSVDRGEYPKIVMFENVKNLVGKKFLDDFNNLVSIIDGLGFNVYWEILNAAECGVPQHRERVFVVCIRKDIDSGNFSFPKPFDNGLRLKDVLHKKVDEKYYVKTPRAIELIKELFMSGKIKSQKARIRKLTPEECYNLMGLSTESCQKCRDVNISDSGLYRQAGNGIVTNCCELIFEHIYKGLIDESYECFDEKIVEQ